MPKLTTRLIVALLTFLLGVAAAMIFLFNGGNAPHKKDVAPVVQEKQKLHLVIPADKWEPIFFKSINERISEANVPSLRTVLPPDDDLEVRVWAGFGVNGVEGLILRRSADQWSAVYLHGMSEHSPSTQYQKNLAAPKSGWEAVWQRLVRTGILTLPDASAVQCNAYGPDGVSYVVEINMNKTYRTYMYNNPNYAKCDQAKKMMEIGGIIAEEFGLEDFRIRE